MARKVCISETTIIEAIDCVRDDRIKQCGTSIVDDIKIESSEIYNIINDNVKREDEVSCANDIKIEFDSGLLSCNHCQEIYVDYCTKCKMLVHILNPNILENTFKGESGEIPKSILEIKELFGRFGIFTLRVIPEGVKFGPFTGLRTSGCCWRLKHGRFIVDKDKSKFLNWMQYINPARRICEQNLLAFQCDNSLFYCTTREIQVNEELFVYLGEEYDESLNNDMEVDFIPPVEEDKKDVFACTFCCLGFSSKTFLNEHKVICLNKVNEKFSIEELMQCPFCKIYLWKKEYFEYHMSYCYERSDRKCFPPKPDYQTIDIKRNRRQRPHIYKCTHCNYKTTYKSDLKSHANQHYEVKMYKCEICKRRFKMEGYLKMHVKNTHGDVDWDEARKWLRSKHMKAAIKARRSKMKCDSYDEVKQFVCSKWEFQTKGKYYLDKHIKSKHLKEFRYKCDMCEHRTNWRSTLKKHIKSKHLKEFNYICGTCGLKTNDKSHLEIHIRSKHLKEFNYICGTCEYKTNNKSNLEIHISKHLKEFNYECNMCGFSSYVKTYLEHHIKIKHLKEFKYKCEPCKYQTNRKPLLEAHMKTKHLKEFDFKCEICEFKTNHKHDLTRHIKAKHLKELKYNCELCEFKTNHRLRLELHRGKKHLKDTSHI